MVIFVFWGSAPRILTIDRGCHGRRQAVGIPIPRRKRCLFLPGTASEHHPSRIWGIFLPERRSVSIPRRKRCLFLPGTASEHHPSRIWGIFLPGRRLVSRSAQEKMPFSAWNRLGAPSEQDLGQFSARQAVGIPFRAGKDAFFCLKPPRSTIRAGFGAFFCPAGGWYPVPRRKRHLFLPGTASEHHPSRIWGNFLP